MCSTKKPYFCSRKRKMEQPMEKAGLDTLRKKAIADYQDNAIALVRDAVRVREMAREPLVMESFVVVIMLKGTATIYMEECEMRLSAGDIFMCRPNSILEKSMISMDLEIRAFVLSEEKVEDLLHETGMRWNFRITASNHEVLHAEEEEVRRLCMYYDLLNDKLNTPASQSKQPALDALFKALVYEFYDLRERKSEDESLAPVNYSSGENIFRQFVRLLEDPRQPFVSVNDYATMLHITPKYFSSVCKRLSGKTAGEIIRDEIIKQAKLLLRDNTLGIKQIANRLNFANQSHFGTYFHRYVGLSPQQFRQSSFN